MKLIALILIITGYFVGNAYSQIQAIPITAAVLSPRSRLAAAFIGGSKVGAASRRPTNTRNNVIAASGSCQTAKHVDFVNSVPRYYCDCPPNQPNYQYNGCAMGR